MLTPSMDLIKQSLVLYKSHWRKFLPYLILLALASFVLQAITGGTLFMDAFWKQSVIITSIVVLVVLVASTLFSLWVGIALTKFTDQLLKNQNKDDWKTMLKSTSHLILPVIGAGILTFLIVLGGSILLIIPGILFAFWYIFVNYEVIIGEKDIMDALRGSKQLVYGRWFSIFWRVIILGIVAFLFSFVINMVIVGLMSFMPSQQTLVYFLLMNLLLIIGSSIVTPFAVLYMIQLYQNAINTPVAKKVATAPPTTPPTTPPSK